jgi:hypothetical protein
MVVVLSLVSLMLRSSYVAVVEVATANPWWLGAHNPVISTAQSATVDKSNPRPLLHP